MVDLVHRPPRDAPQVDRADLLRLVVHLHHRVPVRPQLDCHASCRGGVDPARREAVLRPPEIRSLWPGLARALRDRHGFHVRFQD